MSAAEPFLPVPDPGAESESDALPDDDRLPGDVEDDTDRDGVDPDGDVTRPSRFVTPVVGGGLDADELRRDLGSD